MGHYNIASKHLIQRWPEAILKVVFPRSRVELVDHGPTELPEVKRCTDRVMLAGGFGKLANQNGTFVIRIVDGVEKRVEIAVKDIGQGEAPNFKLLPGDIVYVPESMF